MSRVGRAVATVLGLWFVVALAVGASGLYYGVPTPVIGATNGLLVTLTLIAVLVVRPLRAWVRELPLRWLVLYHAVRFVGIAFLVFHARGTIPAAFAITAGWGDNAVAVTALIVATRALPITNRTRWWVVLLWNVFGLLDILFVLRTGIGLGLADPAQMVWITAFPWSLIPTFIVPLVLVTHVLIFVRLWRLVADVERVIGMATGYRGWRARLSTDRAETRPSSEVGQVVSPARATRTRRPSAARTPARRR